MFSIIILSSFLLNPIDCNTVIRFPGHFNIGALLNIRSPPPSNDPLGKCGKIQEFTGIQNVEAALLSLQMINNSTEILPGVTLGMEICDTCRSSSLALRQSLYLIGSASILNVSDSLENRDTKQCGGPHQKNSNPDVKYAQKSSVISVIGPGSSAETTQVQNLFNLFNIPQMGGFNARPSIYDARSISTGLQIHPCTSCQVKVIHAILNKFNWTYIATIHTTGNMGEGFMNTFRDVLQQDPKICIAKDVKIDTNSIESHTNDELLKISRDESINVIVCICEGLGLRLIFDSIKELNLTDRFTFIVSDSWASLRDTVRGVEEQALGLISIHYDIPSIPVFNQHYLPLKPSTNVRNPWFREFWEDKFNCTQSKSQTDVKVNTNSTPGISGSRKICDGNESLSDGYHEHRKIGMLMRMVWAIAHGLHRMMLKVCGQNYYGVCRSMYPLNTSKLMDHLKNLSFQYENELVTVVQDDLIDSMTSFKIVNYQKKSGGEFDFVLIGDWANDTLSFSSEWQSRSNVSVTSMCSSPCPLGSHKVFTRDNQHQKCCWDCEKCDDYEFVSTDKEQCVKCPEGEVSNSDRTGCVKIPIGVRDWSEPTTIMIVTLSISGLIATSITFYIFLKYKDTPVVKASSRELCYVILSSMILCHVSVFFNLAEPTRTVCALSCSLPPIGLTMMYAGLLTKTNRIARILAQSKKKFPKKKRRLMSTSSQVAITFLCVAIEFVICFAMLSANPPTVAKLYPSRNRAVIICTTSILNTVSVALIIILHALCIVYAIKTRNVPGNFNEAKFMGFLMLFSLITWIFFFTLFFGTSFQVPTLCICLTLIASFTLIFLFFPKLYIIIFKPEKNNRSLFITNKSIRMHIGTYFNSNIGESIFQNSTEFRNSNNSAILDVISQLKRSVGVQTSSELLCNMVSPLNDEIGQLVTENDNYVNSEYDDMSTKSKSYTNPHETVHKVQKGGTSSTRSMLRRREKFSPMKGVKCSNENQTSNSNQYICRNENNDRSMVMTPKSWKELDVNEFLNG